MMLLEAQLEKQTDSHLISEEMEQVHSIICILNDRNLYITGIVSPLFLHSGYTPGFLTS